MNLRDEILERAESTKGLAGIVNGTECSHCGGFPVGYNFCKYCGVTLVPPHMLARGELMSTNKNWEIVHHPK